MLFVLRFENSMRVALVSDIHGNAVALRTVLKTVEQEDPDRIVCLGDVVANGPQPSESLEMITELGCPVVMGNVDEALLTPERIDNKDQYPEGIKDLLRWAASNCRLNRWRVFVHSTQRSKFD